MRAFISRHPDGFGLFLAAFAGLAFVIGGFALLLMVSGY